MQEKYADCTVVMEVVQVIIDVDETGQQKERYGMWKDYANEGMDKTTTCMSVYLPSPFPTPLHPAIHPFQATHENSPQPPIQF